MPNASYFARIARTPVMKLEPAFPSVEASVREQPEAAAPLQSPALPVSTVESAARGFPTPSVGGHRQILKSSGSYESAGDPQKPAMPRPHAASHTSEEPEVNLPGVKITGGNVTRELHHPPASASLRSRLPVQSFSRPVPSSATPEMLTPPEMLPEPALPALKALRVSENKALQTEGERDVSVTAHVPGSAGRLPVAIVPVTQQTGQSPSGALPASESHGERTNTTGRMAKLPVADVPALRQLEISAANALPERERHEDARAHIPAKTVSRPVALDPDPPKRETPQTDDGSNRSRSKTLLLPADHRQPEASPAGRVQPEPQVQIGSVEIHIERPVAPAPTVIASPAPAVALRPLSRSFSAWGLRQG
jgi:hypothetical protein